MMAADYRHIDGLENRLGRHYSRFPPFSPTPALADQSLALRKLCDAGSNRRSRASRPSRGLDLARTFPDTTIILNHVGGVLGVGPYRGRRHEILAGWKKDIAEMAKCPNVNLKLGGIGMTSFGFDFHEREVPPSSEELAAAWRQYIEPCIEAFGV